MFSNKVTPKYYGRFREAVINQEIPVCETISLEMNRIDQLIEDPRYYYDDSWVNAFINFCEKELTLTDGSEVKMLETFKLWSEQIFGWYYFEKKQVYDKKRRRFITKKVKKRLIRKQYLIIPRGAAKSMYMSFMQSFFLVIDPKTSEQITTAPTMKQAETVLNPIKTAITRSRGPLFQVMTMGSIHNTTGSKSDRPMLYPSKKGIENALTGSYLVILPMSIDKLQGYKPKVSTVDEWLSSDIRENVIETLEQGAAKNTDDDYIILAVSSEGTYRNGVGDSIKMDLMNILKGKYKDPHTSIWYYKLDHIEEVGDPAFWVKAQPNIGLTVSWNHYQNQVKKAENVPSERNDIMAKLFNMPMEGYTYFFTYEETKPYIRKLDFWKMPCAMGVDLSRGDDFCAFTFLFPLGDGSFGIKTRCYITSTTLHNLPNAMRIKYQEFINEGSLMIMDDPRYRYLDIQQVYEDLMEYIEDNEYDVQAMGFDPYNAKEFVERWEKEMGSTGIEKVIQGAKTESVPLGEIKQLSQNHLLRFDEKLFSFSMGNCVVLENVNGGRLLQKEAHDRKIDAVAAMVDAWIAFKLHKDYF